MSELFSEDINKATEPVNKLVKTGDNSNAVVYVIILLLAAVAAIILEVTVSHRILLINRHSLRYQK